MGWDAPTPDWIWSVSPLDHAAADRILRTPGLLLVVPEQDQQTLCVTLASVALMAVDFLMQPKMPVETVRGMLNSAVSLMQAAATLRSFPGAPPAPPVAWCNEIMEWLQIAAANAGEAPKKKGAPQNALNQFLYPYLLGIYVVAYDRQPATTPNGPTERFLGAFLDTLAKVMRTLKWDGDPAVIATMPDMVAPFLRPTSIALCKRIRSFVDADNIQTEFVRVMMLHFAANPPLDTTTH